MNKTSNRFAVLAGVVTVVSATASAFALNTASGACDYVFNTNLKVGQRSADVMNLQKVLNMDDTTKIGNSGKETNFFGPATFAAVKRFQKANDITPTSGFVGALTRAELNQVCSGTTNTTTTTTTNTVSTGNTNNVAQGQPSGTIFQGQSAARIAEFTLSGNNTVNAIELTKIGVASNDVLQNVYLYQGAVRLSDSSSVNSSGKIVFNGLNLQVNGSLTVSVRADIPSSGNFVGQSVGVALTGVRNSGDTAFKAITGVAGNSLNIGSGSFNSVTLTNNNGTQITSASPATINAGNAGSLNQIFHEVTLAPGSRAAILKSIAYRFIGSVNANSDLANLTLYVNNNKVATGNVNGNSYVVFDLSNTPVNMNTGSNVVQLRGDVIGGSTYNFQFSLQYVADLLVEDSQVSGFGLAVSNFTGNLLGKYVKVGDGTLVINQNPAFTATKVSTGATNQTIGS
ncbi:MAG: peptidoglycan-binding domain-containing protein [Cyanobium sp. MAG06]|nr:peptidoglycan-binding domain-containing protein [Cyanobium sp. MAG06]